MRNRIFALAALLTSIVVTVAGCGSQVSGSPHAGEIDVRRLDVGSYPIAPIDSTKEYTYAYENGKGSAAIRLGNHMITGLDIDPKLRYNTGFTQITEDDSLQGLFSKPAADAVLKNNYIYGISYGTADMALGSQNNAAVNASLLTLEIMQFKSGDDGDRAAAQMEQADFGAAPGKNQIATVEKYPSAHTHWQSEISTMESVIAHGQYVVSVTTQVHGGDASALTSMVAKVYDKQLPMLDSLPPLSPIEVLKLPPDPDEMTRRLLNVDQIWIPSAVDLASYDQQGFLHLEQDEAIQKKIYDSLHIEKFGTADSYSGGLAFYNPPGFGHLYTASSGATQTGDDLYRSPDEASARDVWAKILNAPDTALAPKDVPDSKCVERPTIYDVRNFTCAVRYRQYVGLVWGRQLSDAQQRAAAQYALLANSQWM